jgi:methylsterol monooxygenase
MDINSTLQAAWTSITASYRPGMVEFMANILVKIVGFIIPATIYMLIDVVSPNFSQLHKIKALADSRLVNKSCTVSKFAFSTTLS